MNSSKILLALLSVAIVGCSSFESNRYSKNMDPNKVLPSYASPNKDGLSVDSATFVRQLDNEDLLAENRAPEFNLDESNGSSQWQIKNDIQIRKSLNLPVLDINSRANNLPIRPNP